MNVPIPFNPPQRARALLYLAGMFGVIALQWANDKGWLDAADRTAGAAVLALILFLATANTLVPTVPAADVITRVDDKGRVITGKAAAEETGKVIGTVPDPGTGAPIAVAAVSEKKLEAA